jgi:hypothetical protein
VVTYGAAPITHHAKAKMPPAARAIRARAWIFVLMANPCVLVRRIRRRPAGGNCPSGKPRLALWSNAVSVGGETTDDPVVADIRNFYKVEP